MNQRLRNWQLAGFLFTAIFGTALHFLFDWTGGNVIAALFSAVNESIWEHMKLIFFPILVFSLIEYRQIGAKYTGYCSVKLLGMILALLLIPVLYYSYTGILGINVDWFNITIFFIVAAFVYWLEYRLLIIGLPCSVPNWLIVSILIAIVLIFFIFTFSTPKIPLFQDPVTGSYGI